MKPLVVFAILLLASCTKEDRSITYDLTCYHCSARYLDADGVSHYVKLGNDTLFAQVDSVINGVDSFVVVIDTIIDTSPYSWSTSFDIHPDGKILFGVSRLSVQGVPTVAKRTIDGMVETKTITVGGEYVEFH